MKGQRQGKAASARPAFRIPVACALLPALLALAGCQSVDGSYANTAQVRFIAASPDAPGIDFYANGKPLVYNQGFGTPSSYVPLAPGSYRISANTAGSVPPQVLASASGVIAANRSYTALVGNTLGSLTATLLPDQSTPGPSGEAAVRLLDQVTRAVAVDVYLLPPHGRLATSAAVATGMALGANSGYLSLPAGTYAVVLLPAGTVPTAATVPLFTGALLPYQPGAVRTVVLIDAGASPAAAGAFRAAPLGIMVADDYDAPGGGL